MTHVYTYMVHFDAKLIIFFQTHIMQINNNCIRLLLDNYFCFYLLSLVGVIIKHYITEIDKFYLAKRSRLLICNKNNNICYTYLNLLFYIQKCANF